MTNEDRIKDLERRVEELEKAARKDWPWKLPQDKPSWPKPNDFPDYIPNKWPLVPQPWAPIDENPIICHICKIRQREGMFYVCGNSQCPNRVTFTCHATD